MESEMVERVAEALFLDDEPYESDVTWKDIGARERIMYRSNAKAAIQAMRVPTDRMAHAPLEQMPEHSNWLNATASWLVWQAMIDAALSPGKSGMGEG